MDTQSYDHATPYSILLCHACIRVWYRELPVAGLLWSAGALAQNRPKFMSDDPLQREPDTQDASKVQEWDIGLLADLTLNLFSDAGRSGGQRSRREHQHDRRGARLELVHEPDLRARRHDRRDHEGAQHVGRSGARASGPSSDRSQPASRRASRFATKKAKSGSSRSMRAAIQSRRRRSSPVATRLFWALGYYQVESHIRHHPSRGHRHRRYRDDPGARQAPADACRAMSTTSSGGRSASD